MNPIRRKLADGGATFGSWFSIQCNLAAEKYGGLGFDWVILEMQHGFADWHNVTASLQALQLGGTPALIRIHRHDPAEIGLALDLGAIGVVAPMVSTPEQARAIAEAVQYPPRGNRSFGPNRMVLGANALTHDPFCVVMIETVEGLKNVDAIAAIPGVDCLLLGGYDLALSLGIGEGAIYSGVNPPEIDAALDDIVAACRRHHKIAADIALDTATAENRLSRGVRFLPIGVAHLFMLEAAKRQLTAVRALMAPFRGGE
jgi:4-hydroxy-2-oxoheptanedioate aldolase